MASSCDYYDGDDFDAILALLEDDELENNPEFEENMNLITSEVEESMQDATYCCSKCPKVCKSQRGLRRHTTIKHKVHEDDETGDKGYAAQVLHPLQLKVLIEKSSMKLAKDQCYPEKIQSEFQGHTITILEANHIYDKLENIINDAAGNAEKFYPRFYKIISDTNPFFSGLTHDSSLLLGMELANHILAFITDCTYGDDVIITEADHLVLSKSEEDSLVYLSGYICGTLYRRLRYKKGSSELSQKYMAILLSAKCDDKMANNVTYKLVSLKDRGGLWKVKKEVVAMFRVAEAYFRKATSGNVKRVDTNATVGLLLKNCTILSIFKSLYQSTDVDVSKEIAFNLLEHMLTLYLRVRTFSYAKDLKQSHKQSNKKVKEKSLRKEIKKSTATLDMGH